MHFKKTYWFPQFWYVRRYTGSTIQDYYAVKVSLEIKTETSFVDSFSLFKFKFITIFDIDLVLSLLVVNYETSYGYTHIYYRFMCGLQGLKIKFFKKHLWTSEIKHISSHWQLTNRWGDSWHCFGTNWHE